MENIDQILDAPQAQDIRLNYAGFWIRTGAYLIDILVMIPVTLVINLAVGDPMGGFINLLIGVAYYGLMESSSYQATLGKMAVGIKVGDMDGDQISVANAIGRYFAKIVSALVLLIGFMMVGWDERKQGLHDKMAGTTVFYR